LALKIFYVPRFKIVFRHKYLGMVYTMAYEAPRKEIHTPRRRLGIDVLVDKFFRI